jgi:replicative DNA helicase
MAEPRMLPHNREAESAVIGAIVLKGVDALNDVLDVLKPEDFYIPALGALFKAMLVLTERGEPIDPITLDSQLRSSEESKLVGGVEEISRYADRYATVHNVRAHAELIRQQAHIRSLVIAAREIADEGMGELEDVREFIDQSEQKILKLNEQGRTTTIKNSRDLMIEVFKSIHERQKRNDPITGIATHFDQLDEMTAGLQPSDLIIIAARPSMGKTAFALNVAQNACVPQTKHMQLPEEERPALAPVLFFSLEMGAEQLIERILCSEARVDFSKLRRGQVSEADFSDLIAAADRIAAAPLFIDDTAAPSILEVRARARRWREDKTIFPPGEDGKLPLGFVMIDYLQLARGGKNHNSREQEISEISRGLKAMAKELSVPVVALSQLNRAVDSRSDHRPMMSDLRESGAIEQDADVIMFIFRPERYLNADSSEEEIRATEGKAEVIIGKQRNGPIGTVHLTFVKKHTRFENPAGAYPGGGG